MAYHLEIVPRAERQIRKLPPPAQVRVIAAIESLQHNPRPTGVKKLGGDHETYRLRLGDFRIIYQIQDRKLIVLILAVGDRKDIYRKF